MNRTTPCRVLDFLVERQQDSITAATNRRGSEIKMKRTASKVIMVFIIFKPYRVGASLVY